MGALSYVGIVTLALGQWVIYYPASAMLLPLVILTILGIGATVRGLMRRGQVAFYTGGAFMVSGFILGALGIIGWWLASFAFTHAVDVCGYSQSYPDPNAQWACPQVQASNIVMWTIAVSLVIPSLLFLGVPYLTNRQRLATANSQTSKSRIE
jgi:hypothetical protein